MKLTEENLFIFTPGSLQYCSRNYCTVVPEITVFLFAEITAFLFPVYKCSIPSTFDEATAKQMVGERGFPRRFKMIPPTVIKRYHRFSFL